MSEMSAPEGIGRPDRLVPRDFKIDARAELKARLREPRIEPGYPPIEDRMRMNSKQIQEWVEGGMDYRAVRRSETSKDRPLGINTLYNHPNYLDGVRRGTAIADDGEQVFPPGTFQESMLPGAYPFDSRGVPVHPYYDIVLEEGAVAGPCQYWKEGPNPSVTSATLVTYEGKLFAATVLRHGQRQLPGGFIDKGENPAWSAFRETREETTGDIYGSYENLDDVRRDFDVFDDFEARILATGRTGINVWEETKDGLFVPKQRELDIKKHPLRAGDDIAEAKGEASWQPVNNATLQTMYRDHANHLMLATLKYEDAYGVRIAPDGTVH